MTALLATLLAQPLPHGKRCGTCMAYDPVPNEPTLGDCLWATELRMWHSSVPAVARCAYWTPAPGCGLDRGGVPLASPASEGFTP